MFKKTISAISLLALSTISAAPAIAGDGLYDKQTNVTAGFYLRIPFGAVKKTDDKIKYGLRLNMKREFQNRPYGKHSFQRYQNKTNNTDLLSLNFNENGLRNLSFAGRKTLLYRNGILMAAEGDDKESSGRSTLAWIGLGTVVVVGIAGVGLLAACIEDNEDDLIQVC